MLTGYVPLLTRDTGIMLITKQDMCYLDEASFHGLYVAAPRVNDFTGLMHSIGIESAGFPGQSDAEIDRLLHMVVVGGGPTGVEVRYILRLPPRNLMLIYQS